VRTILTLFVLVGLARGQGDGPIARSSLVGVRQIEVSVFGLDNFAKNNGLLETDLRTDIELAIRKAGLQIVSRDEIEKVAGQPTLGVGVAVYSADNGTATYSLDVRFQQDVALSRMPKAEIQATTWSIGLVGYIGPKHIPEIRGPVRDLIDHFLNAWLAANPPAR
jgi:hypothetical protein